MHRWKAAEPPAEGELILVLRKPGGVGEVALAIGIGNACHDAGWRPLDPHEADEAQGSANVHEILIGAKIQHADHQIVHHGVRRKTGWQVDVEHAVFTQHGGMEGLGDANGGGYGRCDTLHGDRIGIGCEA